MKRISLIGLGLLLAASCLGAAACGQGGQGCGGPTEQELDEQARSKTQQITTTCGPGTHLEGTVCVRNTQTTGTTATTLGN